MLPHEWFGVALRIVGVVVSLYGLAYLLDSFLLRLGYFFHPDTHFTYYLIFGIAYIVAGACLIWGAPHIVRIAYLGALDEYEDEGEDDEEELVNPR